MIVLILFYIAIEPFTLIDHNMLYKPHITSDTQPSSVLSIFHNSEQGEKYLAKEIVFKTSTQSARGLIMSITDRTLHLYSPLKD